MAAIDCFLKHPGYNRSNANAAILSYIFGNSTLGRGVIFVRFQDDGQLWVAMVVSKFW